MRSLSSTLLAAQRSTSGVPYLRCTVTAEAASLPRLAWERYYAGPEPDAPHALAVAGDGSLVRARVGAANVEVMRVPNPGATSSYGAWAPLGTAAGTLCLAASGASVVLCCVPDSSGDVYELRSADYGASWSAAALVQSLGQAGAPVAAAFSDASRLALFFAVGGTVYIKQWTSGGGWAGAVPWTHSVAMVTGLAVCYRGDWKLLVTGTDASGSHKLWSTIYGDGYSYSVGTWGPLEEIIDAGAASSITYAFPALTFADTYRGTVVEDASSSGGASRPNLLAHLRGQDLAAHLWLEPWPFDTTSRYGLSIAFDATSLAIWLAKPGGVWRAPLVTAPNVDLSADLLRAAVEERPDRGRAVLELRNDDGRYNAPGTGSLSALTIGARLSIAPGYRTSVGNESSAGGPAYFITALEQVFRDGQARLRIEAEDGWHWLAAWRARRSIGVPAGSRNVFQLIAFFVARAGFELSVDGSASESLTSLKPAFHLAPGESAEMAVRRLLSTVPEVGRWEGARFVVRQVRADDASVYRYGEGEHPVLAGRRALRIPARNHARVAGAGGEIGEAFDFASVDLVYERADFRHAPYGNAESVAEAAYGLLREAAVLTPAGEIETPVNSGLELWDVVTIAFPPAGWAEAEPARVIGIRLEYDRAASSRYRQVLTLGRV